MKHIDFDFNGKTYALSFTAEALFTIYDKFGLYLRHSRHHSRSGAYSGGLEKRCWLAALMASQGELQRRHRGESPQQMLTLEELRTGFMAADSVSSGRSSGTRWSRASTGIFRSRTRTRR